MHTKKSTNTITQHFLKKSNRYVHDLKHIYNWMNHPKMWYNAQINNIKPNIISKECKNKYIHDISSTHSLDIKPDLISKECKNEYNIYTQNRYNHRYDVNDNIN